MSIGECGGDFVEGTYCSISQYVGVVINAMFESYFYNFTLYFSRISLCTFLTSPSLLVDTKPSSLVLCRGTRAGHEEGCVREALQCLQCLKDLPG